jgi:hypothetical protein
MYAYHRTESNLWTVYDDEPRHPVSDHSTEADARDEAIRLNGGTPASETGDLAEEISELRDRVEALETSVEKLLQDLDNRNARLELATRGEW